MKQGWLADDYIILFEKDEVELYNTEYENQNINYKIIGIYTWDYFLLLETNTLKYYITPTVPFNFSEIEYLNIDIENVKLENDANFYNKIKWWVKPIVFGGDPEAENSIFVDITDHIKCVKFWNKIYNNIIRSNKAL